MDGAVRLEDPVAAAGGDRFDVDGVRRARGAAEVAGITEGVDGAGGVEHPVSRADGQCDRR
jgi:hypothetical protein